ncbi:MAG TPA: enoyl-CoA hydratase-related protein [Actinomycetota bacterium]|nr:enoyl-CoA hydratase-related protein [Actinomycetota bacterium]
MSDSVLLSRTGAALHITLNRPEVFNVFDDDMGRRFLEGLTEAADPSVRAVLITGAGKAFCGGEDLKALSSHYEAGEAPDLGEILLRRYNPAIEAIISLEKPVIAAVNGVAAGAGFSLALACDLRVMAENSSFVLAFPKVGLVPDSGGTWLLPRYLGPGRALEVALLADPIKAARALELGLVNSVVPADELATAAADLVRRLAEGPTIAFGLSKRLIWESSQSSLVEHLTREADAQRRAGLSGDHLEGVKAFGEKRSPRFTGA